MSLLRADAARAAATEYGIKHVVDSLDALVRHPEVDLVLVLNTAPQHADTVRAAIAAGKDVYCEWPLTPSVETSKELVRLADAAGVRTVVGLQRRLAPHNRYLGDLLKQGFVGRLRSVRAHPFAFLAPLFLEERQRRLTSFVSSMLPWMDSVGSGARAAC